MLCCKGVDVWCDLQGQISFSEYSLNPEDAAEEALTAANELLSLEIGEDQASCPNKSAHVI